MGVSRGTPITEYGRFPICGIKDIDGNIFYGAYQVKDLKIGSKQKTITDESTVNLRNTIPGVTMHLEEEATISLFGVSPDIEALLSGATVGAVAGYEITKPETITPAGAPPTFTLANPPSLDCVLIVDKHVAGTREYIRYKEVAVGSEVVGESYSLAGAVVTFAAAETLTQCQATYLYAVAGTDNIQITHKLDDLPGLIKLNITSYGRTAGGKDTITLYSLYRCFISEKSSVDISAHTFQKPLTLKVLLYPRSDGTSGDDSTWDSVTSGIAKPY